MLRLAGITPVMVTCFRDDESVDDHGLRVQIDAAIGGGASAVCGPGFGSEFYKLSDEERHHFVEVLVRHVKGRVPVIAGTSCGSAHATIDFSRRAERLGADCVMVAAPRVVRLPEEEIVSYYSRLCEAVAIPVMLQDADFGGSGLPTGVFVDLARRHSNLSFAKLEVALSGRRCAEIVERTSGQVQVVYGLGGIAMLDGLAHGASAMMPGSACIEVYAQVYELYHQKNPEGARALFDRLVPYLAFGQQNLEVAILLEKRVLQRRGILPSSRMRQPTFPLDPHYRDEIDELVSTVVGLSEQCGRARREPSGETAVGDDESAR
jgi:dihydrodipicolinate synthase/N-acetylneuraminate lyase